MEEFYSLGFLTNRLSVALEKALNTALNKSGVDITQSQFVVLRCLYYKDGLSQFDIANLLSKDAAGIKRVVDKLEEKGLVERHEVRTLKNSIQITEKGRTLMPSLLEIANDVTDKAWHSLTKQQRESLSKTLDKVFKNLKEYIAVR